MDEELVYKQNMSRNEAVKILKAITIPLAVFALGLSIFLEHSVGNLFARYLVLCGSLVLWSHF